MRALSFDDLLSLAGGRIGKFDVPCPLCSHLYNPRKRVLRIWHETSNFIGYACARCGEKGWARGDGRPASPDRLVEIRREAAERRAGEVRASRRTAQWLWSAARPIESTSPPAIYLRETRGYRGLIPHTLRYLPPREPKHQHAMIAAIGLAYELPHLSPGSYVIADEAVVAVHLTKLHPDGSSKARDAANAKIIVGQGSVGFPICLAPPNDSLGLAITEGIEDALSTREATGLGAWAAGCAGRLPALAGTVPAWIDCVSILMDADAAGQDGAAVLHRALIERGIHAELVALAERSAAA